MHTTTTNCRAIVPWLSLGDGGCACVPHPEGAHRLRQRRSEAAQGALQQLDPEPHDPLARRNDPDPSSCHRSQTFCVDCHTATKVVEVDGSRPPSGKTFHPSGWVEFADASGRDAPAQGIRGENHHSFQAQLNIRACASCHTESSCIARHGAAGDNVIARTLYRISPHSSYADAHRRLRARAQQERA